MDKHHSARKVFVFHTFLVVVLSLFCDRAVCAGQTTDTATINAWNAKSFALLTEDPAQAKALALQALNASRSENYLVGLSDAYMRLGLLHKNAGLPDSALFYYHKSLHYREELDNKDLIARACSNIGNIYHKTGLYDSAIHYHLRAVKLAEALGDTTKLITYENNTGIAFQKYKDYANARRHYERSIAFSRLLDRETDEDRAASNLASVYVDEGNYSKALEILRPMMNDKTDPGQLANIYNNAGLSWQSLGNIDSALYAFEAALQITGDPVSDDAAAYLSNIGMLHYERAAYASAAQYFEQSNHIAAHAQDKKMLSTNYRYLGFSLEALGKYKDAVRALAQAIAYEDSVNNEARIKAVEELRTQYETEKKEAQIKSLELEQKITALDRDRQKQLRNVSIAAFCVIIVIVILLFKRRSLSKKVEYQQKLTADRTRISADLHDDIGSALSSISMYSELAKDKMQGGDHNTLQAYLTEIADTSRELLDSMGDLVWAVNPANDTMEKFLLRIQSFGTRLCMPRAIAFRFAYDPILEQREIDMEARHCLYMIMKEAINNAVKYSGARTVEVNLRATQNGIDLSVQDDGKGFDVTEEYDGNGLRNIQRRAAQIQADHRFFSEPYKQTGVHVVYQYDVNHRRW